MDENTGIAVAETAPGRGEWDVDAAEIMEGVRDEDEAAPEGETVQSDTGGFRLKHLDAEYTVDRDKVVELAQKGLDYDRVRSKLESAREELAGLKAEAERAGVDVTALPGRGAQTGAGAERAKREVREFFAAHPDVAARLVGDRGAIPDEVWRRVRAGESLSAAWEGAQLRAEASEKAGRVRELERELAETRQAALNASRSTGSAATAGGDVERDMAAIGWNTV